MSEFITIVGPKGAERVASREAFEQIWEPRGWTEKGAKSAKSAPKREASADEDAAPK